MVRPKKVGPVLTGAERAALCRKRKREDDEEAFLKAQREQRALNRDTFNANLPPAAKKARTAVATAQVSITYRSTYYYY